MRLCQQTGLYHKGRGILRVPESGKKAGHDGTVPTNATTPQIPRYAGGMERKFPEIIGFFPA